MILPLRKGFKLHSNAASFYIQGISLKKLKILDSLRVKIEKPYSQIQNERMG
jgi:hypothetical protein